MKTSTQIDYVVDQYVCPDLTGLAPAGYHDPDYREFCIINSGPEIAKGTIQVIPAAGRLRDLYSNTGNPILPAASAEWIDLYLFHGATYLWCSDIRLNGAAVMPAGSVLDLGFAKSKND